MILNAKAGFRTSIESAFTIRPRGRERLPCQAGVLFVNLVNNSSEGNKRSHADLMHNNRSAWRRSNSSAPTETGTCQVPSESSTRWHCPALRRGHDRDSEIYRCRVINMRLLRFFVALSSVARCRRALARRSIRVFTPCRHALTQLSVRALAGTCGVVDDLHAAFPIRRCSSSSRLGTKLPFKPHNSTRPPQTPAASS